MTEKEQWFKAKYQGVTYEQYEISNLGRAVKIKNGERTPILFEAGQRRMISLKIPKKLSFRTAFARVLYCTYNDAIIPRGLVVDHIDNDPLNDQMDNLQLLTNAENIKKYHAWKKSIRKFYPFKSWHPYNVTLQENNLYNSRCVFLGKYPTEQQGRKAREIAKEIKRLYKIKNNDKILIEIAAAIKEYRASLGIPPVKRSAVSTSKKADYLDLWDEKNRFIYPSIKFS